VSHAVRLIWKKQCALDEHCGSHKLQFVVERNRAVGRGTRASELTKRDFILRNSGRITRTDTVSE